MKWSDFERYLKAEHLGGRRVTATITKVTTEITHPNGRPEETPVIYFAGKQRGLILTPHNRATLKEIFGNDVAACVGKAVQLEAVPMDVAGKHTMPVRIFPAPQPPPTAPAVPPAPPPAPQPAPTDPSGWEELKRE